MKKEYIVIGHTFRSSVIVQKGYIISCSKPITGFLYQSLSDLKKWCDKKHFLVLESKEKTHG